jgi:hypothetical protein
VSGLEDLLNEAAERIEEDAQELLDGYTLNGQWDGTDPEAEAAYGRDMDLARRLREAADALVEE